MLRQNTDSSKECRRLRWTEQKAQDQTYRKHFTCLALPYFFDVYLRVPIVT
jgi:hypothetical protein